MGFAERGLLAAADYTRRCDRLVMLCVAGLTRGSSLDGEVLVLLFDEEGAVVGVLVTEEDELGAADEEDVGQIADAVAVPLHWPV